MMPDLGNEEEWYAWFSTLNEDHKKEIQGIAELLPRVGPQPGPQTAAFNSRADILGYGGAAGGGKTALIALLSLLKHERTVVYRDDAKQLRGFIDDLVKFNGTKAGLNAQMGYFYFTESHMCEWGGLADPGSEMAWQGRAHDLFAADEVTALDLNKLLWLMTWMRTTTPGQRCRAVFTFNPPGSVNDVTGKVPLGRWVIEFFAPWIDERHVNPAAPGELRYFITNEAGESQAVDSTDPVELKLKDRVFIAKPRSRTFIPATVQDNAYLANTGYEQTLLGLPEPFRSQMLLGEFKSGIMDSPYQIIPSKWLEEAMDRWEKHGHRDREMSALGVDVARGGRAFTVLSPRHGFWWDKLERHKGSETPEGHTVAALCAQRIRDAAWINVDANGVGAAPFDVMDGANMRVNGVIPQQRKGLYAFGDKLKMYNMRTWLYWCLRTILDPARGLNPMIPYDKRLRSDLVAVQWSLVGGFILAESKEDVFNRLGRSTDDGDAITLSLYNVMQEPEWERIISRPDTTKKGHHGMKGRRKQGRKQSWMSR